MMMRFSIFPVVPIYALLVPTPQKTIEESFKNMVMGLFLYYYGKISTSFIVRFGNVSRGVCISTD